MNRLIKQGAIPALIIIIFAIYIAQKELKKRQRKRAKIQSALNTDEAKIREMIVEMGVEAFFVNMVGYLKFKEQLKRKSEQLASAPEPKGVAEEIFL